jgi:hypothetical protein
MNNLDTNPYFTRGDGGKTLDNTEFKTVKALLKLPTGIFQNDRVFPLQMTQGLRIEIILEDPNRVFRQLETTLKHKRVTSNPVFHSLSGSNASRTPWATSASATSFFLERHNGVVSVDSCPFAVGDTVAFVNPREVDIDAPGDSLVPADGSAGTAVCKAVITNIEYDATAGGGTATTGLVKVTVTEVQNLWAEAITPSATKPFYVYSAGVELATSYNPTCSVDNVELQVQQVEMPQGYVSKMNSMLKAGGAMNYDFLSFTNYKYSQLQSDRVVNIRLPIQNSRCKAILAIPTDATPYSAKDTISADNTYLVNNITRDTGGGDYSYNNSTRSGPQWSCRDSRSRIKLSVYLQWETKS